MSNYFYHIKRFLLHSTVPYCTVRLHRPRIAGAKSKRELKMKVLSLTPSQIYSRKQRAWKAYCDFERRIIRAFFPDTGGTSLFMHNWYICAEKSNPAGSKLAQWVQDSTYARYKRIMAKLEANAVEREHKFGDHGKRFDPLWCPICNPHKASSYGYELVNGQWQKRTA